MSIGEDVRRCLIELDVQGIRRLWQLVAPAAPQPTSDREALVALHRARTQAESLPARLRFYSHRWLLDGGYPSGLPDELRARAERVYPQVQEGVGMAALLPQAHTPLLRRVAEDAVMDIYADQEHPDPAEVKRRILEVRARERRKLGV